MERIWVVTKEEKGLNKEPVGAFVDQLAASEFVANSNSLCISKIYDKKLVQLDESFPDNMQFFSCEVTVGKADRIMNIYQVTNDNEVIDFLNDNAENISNSIVNTFSDSGELVKSMAKLFFLARKPDDSSDDFYTLFTTSLYIYAVGIIKDTIKNASPAPLPVMEPTMRFTKIISSANRKQVELVDSTVRERLLKVLTTNIEQGSPSIFG